MDPVWTVVSVAMLVAVALVLAGLGRDTGGHVWRSWDVALTSEAPDRLRYDAYGADLEDERESLDATLKLARTNAERGELAEAARVVRLAARHAVRHVPTLHRRLGLWNDTLRALSAVSPLPRLHVRAFRHWRLRGLAAGEGALRLALDAARRFALRVWVLAFGLRVVLRGFAGVAQDEEAPPDSATVARALHRLETLGHDLGTLHGASLEVYRALLISLHTPAKPDAALQG